MNNPSWIGRLAIGTILAGLTPQFIEAVQTYADIRDKANEAQLLLEEQQRQAALEATLTESVRKYGDAYARITIVTPDGFKADIGEETLLSKEDRQKKAEEERKKAEAAEAERKRAEAANASPLWDQLTEPGHIAGEFVYDFLN